MSPDLAGRRAAAIESRREVLLQKFEATRQHSERICQTLSPEDCVIQSMPDVSPIRWHLAHTTWFFETFVLKRFPGYDRFCEQFEYLFNSYYNTVGDQFPRSHRGLLSRPTVDEIFDYRRAVDEQMIQYLERDYHWSSQLLAVVELGLHHEQQHQELMLTDIKHVFAQNPLHPAVVDSPLRTEGEEPSQQWISFDAGVERIGHAGDAFAFDNESPRHRVFLEPFSLSNRLVTNGEYLQFIEDGGYQRPEFWLSLGWAEVNSQSWTGPLYWSETQGKRYEFTLSGLLELDPQLPVTHVSYFEADAFARWVGARLPTEAEWEVAASPFSIWGNFAEDHYSDDSAIHPSQSIFGGEFYGLFGEVWQWTGSSYSPYPGYQPPSGALGEYNGKFMCNQYVLRGGSCATSRDHLRISYRNFFPPDARWQFTGIRLAKSDGI